MAIIENCSSQGDVPVALLANDVKLLCQIGLVDLTTTEITGKKKGVKIPKKTRCNNPACKLHQNGARANSTGVK